MAVNHSARGKAGQMIETFLFDMGNVLVHFCHDRMCRQIGERCGKTGAEVRAGLIGTELQWQFESGRHTPEEFHQLFQRQMLVELAADDFYRASSDIFTLNESIVPVLETLKRLGHRLVLLSNTSIWHIRWVRENYRVLDLFDDLTVSYEAGAIKPGAAIYERALTKIHCPPENCFYTDDIPAYVEAGRKYGLQAEVFTTTEQLRRQLADRGISV